MATAVHSVLLRGGGCSSTWDRITAHGLQRTSGPTQTQRRSYWSPTRASRRSCACLKRGTTRCTSTPRRGLPTATPPSTSAGTTNRPRSSQAQCDATMRDVMHDVMHRAVHCAIHCDSFLLCRAGRADKWASTAPSGRAFACRPASALGTATAYARRPEVWNGSILRRHGGLAVCDEPRRCVHGHVRGHATHVRVCWFVLSLNFN